MRWPGKIWLRFRSLFRRRAADGELADELRFHLERAVEQNLARGMTPEEARRRALLELGGVEQVKEECRDARGWNFLDDTWRDVCYTARMLRNSPGFTLVAVLSGSAGTRITALRRARRPRSPRCARFRAAPKRAPCLSGRSRRRRASLRSSPRSLAGRAQ
jgi:hypothetical protein